MLSVGLITNEISRDFEYALEVVKELGIKYIELHCLWNKTIEDLSDREVERAKKLIDKYKLTVSNISSTCFLLCPLRDENEKLRNITENFLAVWGNYATHLSYLKRAIYLAHEFNTSMVRIFAFRKMNPSQRVDEAMLDEIIEKLKEPVALAEDAKVVLTLENCAYSYLGQGELTSEIVTRINSNNVKLLWDPANAVLAGGVETYPTDYQFVKDHVVHIHVRDVVKDKITNRVTFVPFGQGEINYKAIFQSLKKDGYTGVISLEPEYYKDGFPEEGTRKSLRELKKLLDSLT